MPPVMGKSVKEGIMPKETVRGSNYQFIAVPPGVDIEDGPNFPPGSDLGVVEVGWTKAPAGSVEVVTSDPVMIEHLITFVQKTLADGDPVAPAIRSFFHNGTGFWIHLDRDGCNDLVDRLRVARNGAYRKDA